VEISRLSDLRPRTVWDVVDDAFDLYRENFALYAGIAAALYVPGYVVYLAWIAASYGRILAASGGGGLPAGFLSLFLGGAAFVIPLFGVAYILQTGATAAAVEDRLAGRATGILPAYRRALARFWPLLGAALLVLLLAGLGVFTLYVLTIVVFVYYAFAPQAVVLERRGRAGGPAPLARSGEGLRRQGLRPARARVAAHLAAHLRHHRPGRAGSAPDPAGGDAAAQELRKFIVNQVIGALVGVLLAPLLPLAATLLYYDLRVRREGFDIAARAAEIGFPLAPDPFGDALHPRTPPARSALPRRWRRRRTPFPAAAARIGPDGTPPGGGIDDAPPDAAERPAAAADRFGLLFSGGGVLPNRRCPSTRIAAWWPPAAAPSPGR
jgi:hypothetical protein